MQCNYSRTMNYKWAYFIVSSIFSVILLTFVVTAWTSKTDDDVTPGVPTAQTPRFKYIGALSTLDDGSHVTKFLGIPFARPPIGPLRFKRPQPLRQSGFRKTIKADIYKKSCNSVTKKATNKFYGEDCLYLNVYIPGNRTMNAHSASCDPLSVMVWLHPGGFVAGSTFPEPTKLVVRGNVIVVTVNYRMGVFGFLTTNDDALPSNNGLWDQHMAIKWVHENIRYFGGDVNSITVFGESAGAISTHILTLSPVSSHLFQKAIIQSGTASSLISRDFEYYAISFGEMVGCNNYSNHEQLANCLRNVSVADILSHDLPSNFNIPQARRQLDFIWTPVVDGEFIVDYPNKLLKNKTFLESVGAFQKDYIIGFLDNEGGLAVNNFLNSIPLTMLQNVTFYEDLVDYLFYVKYGLKPNETSQLSKILNSFYLGSENFTSISDTQMVLDAISDNVFISSSLQAALATSFCNKTEPPLCDQSSISKTAKQPTTTTINLIPNCTQATAKVFVYLFDYCPDTDPCQVKCMSHGSDVQYEFPKTPFNNEDQNKLSDIFVDVLTTFAKTSQPGTAIPSGWPTFEPENQYYLRLSPSPAVRQYVYPYRTRLWLETLDKMAESIVEDINFV